MRIRKGFVIILSAILMVSMMSSMALANDNNNEPKKQKPIHQYVMTEDISVQENPTYTVSFSANGSTIFAENITLSHTFRGDYNNQNGELDRIISDLYGLLDGRCDPTPPSVTGGNGKVVVGLDGNDQFITISDAFDGTATVTGFYTNLTVTVPYSLEITCDNTVPYPLWVGNTRVTSQNKDDVLGNADKGATVKYDPDTKTLTLNGATISEPYHTSYAYIHSEGIDLNIVLNGENKVGINAPGESARYAIDVNEDNSEKGGSLIIDGSGSLTVNGKIFAIYTYNDCEIKGGKITATSFNQSAILNQSGACKISGGEVTATSETEHGIFAYNNDVIITGGTVNAISDDFGIICGGNATISAGNVTATGNKDCGISADNVVIKKGVDSFVASSDNEVAIDGTLNNEIAGTGWTDTKGTKDKTVIAAGEYKKDDIKKYKRVQFVKEPEPAPVVSGPEVTTTAKASAKTMTIKWSWDKASTAKSYKVAYRKAGSSKWKVKKVKKTKYVVKGLKARGLYEFKVAAVTDAGDVWSDVHYRYFRKVQAKAKAGTGTINVSWKKDKKATGYEVFVANNKKMKDAQVFQVASTEKSYVVSGLGTGKYYVKVRPVKTKDGVTYTGIKCSARLVKVK